MTSFLNSIGKKKKAHEQLVVTTKQAVQALVDSATQKEEDRLLVLDTVSKSLAEMKSQLCGTSDTPAVDEEKAVELSKHLQQEGVIALLISSLDQLSVETRKDFVSVFGQLLKKNYGGFTDYVATNSNLVDGLMQGYASEAALTYGSLIRECLRYEPLAAYLLSSERLWDFFTSYVHIPNFDTASDAFNTLKELLTVPKHRHVAEEFMQRNCDKLLENYDVLLQSENYVTRRRSLKLLAEILLDRSNYTVMMRYISSKHNLKTIMNLLRNKSSQIQLESFHLFKIFVANPAKTPEIESTLYKNRVKLIAYLESFHPESEDPQFVDERRLLIDTLQQMTEPAAQSTPSGDAAGSTSSGDSTAGESQQGSPDRDADLTAVAQGMHRVTVSDLTTMSTTGSALGDEAPLSEGPSDKP